MRVLAYVSTFAIALIPLLLPVPCTAQIAVPLTIPLPLEVRSPYLNFWTRASNSSGNATTDAEFFFAEAVRHVSPFFWQSTYHLVDIVASPLH
jgi:hypothetical protein